MATLPQYTLKTLHPLGTCPKASPTLQKPQGNQRGQEVGFPGNTQITPAMGLEEQ